MRKVLLSVFVFALVISGCSVPSTLVREEQFIDVDDTLQIKAGMNKVEALDTLGKPVEVVRGILMEDGKTYEIWRYFTKQGFGLVDVKDLPRKPPKNMKFEVWAGAERKTSLFIFEDKSFIKVNEEKSKSLFLLFKDDKLVRWGDFKFHW